MRPRTGWKSRRWRAQMAAGSRPSKRRPRSPLPAWSPVTWAVILVALVIVVFVGIAALAIGRAATAGRSGQRALLQAVDDLKHGSGVAITDTQLRQAETSVADARQDFDSMRRDLRDGGPALAVARHLPFLRVQVRGADTLADAGQELGVAATDLIQTADRLVNPQNPNQPLSDPVAALQPLQRAALGALGTIDQATDQLASLNGYRLVGPLGTARAALAQRLPHLRTQAVDAEQALRGFMIFAGGAGPRRYLVLSQNPDEVRPTGGYIGTYGFLTASGGHLDLASYDAIEHWYDAHPTALVPESEAATPLEILGSGQNLANVNALPDWPTDAQLASKLWQEGGQPAVDGVVSMTPEFLARLVAVLGPVQVPGYGETVTGANLLERVNFWVHTEAGATHQVGGRKEFVSQLSQAVMKRLLAAPASQWQPLAEAGARGFDAGEAMMWSTDPQVALALSSHGWDHAFPPAGTSSGDFFYDSEFAAASKNGSGIRRTFVHDVVLHPDGSGRAATTITVRDTEPFNAGYNQNTDAYMAAYGPAGSQLDGGASDPPYYGTETGYNGHPEDNWFTGAPPLGAMTVRTAFDAPHLLEHVGGNRWTYSLTFLRVTAHDGDVLQLHVALPPGWRWAGDQPPARVVLNQDFRGSWTLLAP